jgi:hypothetical protein
VTGVQTCALPILMRAAFANSRIDEALIQDSYGFFCDDAINNSV